MVEDYASRCLGIFKSSVDDTISSLLNSALLARRGSIIAKTMFWSSYENLVNGVTNIKNLNPQDPNYHYGDLLLEGLRYLHEAIKKISPNHDIKDLEIPDPLETIGISPQDYLDDKVSQVHELGGDMSNETVRYILQRIQDLNDFYSIPIPNSLRY